MADNLKIRQPEDPKKININQDWEVKEWTKELGVSETKLKAAVKEVGPIVKDVKKYLGKYILNYLGNTVEKLHFELIQSI